MDEQKLLNVLNNTLQQKSNELQNNELFSLTSLIVLIEILSIFNKTSQNNMPINTENMQNNQLNNSSLNNMIQNLQQSNSSDLQQMLPLLMGALNGGNANIGNLMSMLKNSMNNKQSNNETDEKSSEDEENNKRDSKKKNLDWSKLRL